MSRHINKAAFWLWGLGIFLLLAAGFAGARLTMSQTELAEPDFAPKLYLFAPEDCEFISVLAKEFQERYDCVLALEYKSESELTGLLTGRGEQSPDSARVLAALPRSLAEKFSGKETLEWHFLCSTRPVILYNQNLVSEREVPGRLAELGKMPHVRPLAYAGAESSALTALLEDSGKLTFAGGAHSNMIVMDTQKAVEEAVCTGEYPMGLSTEAAARRLKPGRQLAYLSPEDISEERYVLGNVILSEGAQEPWGQRFLAFCAQREVKRLLSQYFYWETDGEGYLP